METITINIARSDVYEEVAKATDYTGSKLTDADETARDRILATDDDLVNLGRFWDESVSACNENFKEMLRDWSSGGEQTDSYSATLEVSKNFDKGLTRSIESTLRSFFIASIIGQWSKFANKGEAADYFTQAAEMLDTAERMLYSRKRPALPTD